MATKQQLKSRIQSVQLTGKITKTMELVATAKLKRISRMVSAVKPYYTEVYAIFNQLLARIDKSIYLKSPSTPPPTATKPTLWIVVNSSLGLCGAYNINLNKLVVNTADKSTSEILTIGSKAEIYFRVNKYKIAAKYNNEFADKIDYNLVRQIALIVLQRFHRGEIAEIKLAYTKFINNLTFEPTILNLLPIEKQALDKTKGESKTAPVITEFEPDEQTILKTTIPLYLSAVIYGALIEAQVSEQASRRLAMETASDNADELNESLTLAYNRVRQAAITQEINEIVAGSEAESGAE